MYWQELDGQQNWYLHMGAINGQSWKFKVNIYARLKIDTFSYFFIHKDVQRNAAHLCWNKLCTSNSPTLSYREWCRIDDKIDKKFVPNCAGLPQRTVHTLKYSIYCMVQSARSYFHIYTMPVAPHILASRVKIPEDRSWICSLWGYHRKVTVHMHSLTYTPKRYSFVDCFDSPKNKPVLLHDDPKLLLHHGANPAGYKCTSVVSQNSNLFRI